MPQPALSDANLQKLYTWIDDIPLSRPKRNISRDFSDAVLVAEVISHYFPKLISLHNYSPANSTPQKLYNWNTLNDKVLRKLGWQLGKGDIEDICMCKAGCIEGFLHGLQFRMAKFRRMIGREGGGEEGGAGGGYLGDWGGVSGNQEQEQQYNRAQQHYDSPQNNNPNTPPPAAPPQRNNHHHSNNVNTNATTNNTITNDKISTAILLQKTTENQELAETIEILELKIKKLEQLVRLKDGKILRLLDVVNNTAGGDTSR